MDFQDKMSQRVDKIFNESPRKKPIVSNFHRIGLFMNSNRTEPKIEFFSNIQYRNDLKKLCVIDHDTVVISLQICVDKSRNFFPNNIFKKFFQEVG